MAKCFWCEDDFDEKEMHLHIDFGDTTDKVERDCMFEYLYENFVSNGNASEFIVALTEGFEKYIKGKVK